jgi:ATP-dependent DNA ligase
MELSLLKKKEPSGKIRKWEIFINSPSPDKASVYVSYGYQDGKIRKTKPTIFKNTKRNTARENAFTYAKKKWISQKRKGYEEYLTKELETNRNFVRPMSAILLEGNEHKLKFPMYAQLKLDGYRGMTRRNLQNNKIEILSKTGLPFPHLNIIKKQLNSFPFLKKPGSYLDGEIYLHKNSFFDLRKVLGRKKIDSEEIKEIENKIVYVVFDCFQKDKLNAPFSERWNQFIQSFEQWDVPLKERRVKPVLTKVVKNIEDVQYFRKQSLKDGYEGIILRASDSVYVSGKRSLNVFRSKEFKKGIFKIIGANEGKGENKGTVVWIVECSKNKNKFFYSSPIGTKQERTKWFQDKEHYIGRKVEIKYMDLDPKTGCVTRFPIAVRFVSKS